MPYLIETRNIVLAAHSERPRGYKAHWTVTLAALIDTYRAEVARMRQADAFNLKQKLKNREKGLEEPDEE